MSQIRTRVNCNNVNARHTLLRSPIARSERPRSHGYPRLICTMALITFTGWFEGVTPGTRCCLPDLPTKPTLQPESIQQGGHSEHFTFTRREKLDAREQKDRKERKNNFVRGNANEGTTLSKKRHHSPKHDTKTHKYSRTDLQEGPKESRENKKQKHPYPRRDQEL
jgi:hypothetical protein